jgi:predicted dehydrogenase
MDRRDFIKRTTAAGGACLFDIVPARALGLQGQPPPSDIINIGHIGIGVRGTIHLRPEADVGKKVPVSPTYLGGDGTRIVSPARSVALCEVDSKRLDEAATTVGGRPKVYRDFRRLLENKDVDAVYIATPDHWHALMTIMACQAGKDVYVEKPACNTIEEGRAMVTAAERYGRVVQVGAQGRSHVIAWQAANYIRAGQLGTIRKITHWHYGSPVGGWSPDTVPPDGFDYDLWLGPARWLPYNARRTHERFRWLMDFGGGQIRDRGAHLFSLASWIMESDNTGPIRIEAKGEPPHDGMYDSAVTMEVTYEFKNPDWTMVWAQPGEASREVLARGRPATYGSMYWGDKGHITLPEFGATDVDQKVKDYSTQCDCGKVFRSPGHTEDFMDCVRSREKPVMSIEAGHRVTSLCILGNLAFQLGRTLEWDPIKERFLNDQEANRLLSRPGRGPWNL